MVNQIVFRFDERMHDDVEVINRWLAHNAEPGAKEPQRSNAVQAAIRWWFDDRAKHPMTPEQFRRYFEDYWRMYRPQKPEHRGKPVSTYLPPDAEIKLLALFEDLRRLNDALRSDPLPQTSKGPNRALTVNVALNHYASTLKERHPWLKRKG